MERSAPIAPGAARGAGWIPLVAGLGILALSLVALGSVPVEPALFAALLWIGWLLARRRRRVLGRALFGLSLFGIWAGALSSAVTGPDGGMTATLLRHDALIVFVLFALALVTAAAAPAVSRCHPPEPRRSPPPDRWAYPVLALAVSVLVVACFALLVRAGDPLWVKVRPIGHDLIVIAAAAALVASRGDAVRFPLGRRRPDLIALFMIGIVPLHAAVSVFRGTVVTDRSREPAASAVARGKGRNLLARSLIWDDRRSAAEQVRTHLPAAAGDPVASFYRGIALSAAGDWTGAQTAFRAAAERPDPLRGADLVGAAIAEYGVRRLLQFGFPGCALVAAERARTQFGGSDEMRLLAAEAAVAAGGTVREAALRAIAAVPESPQEQYLLGVLSEQEGKGREAWERYETACLRSPLHGCAWAGLSRLAVAFPDLFTASQVSRVEGAVRRLEMPCRSSEDLDGLAVVTGFSVKPAAAPAPASIRAASASPLLPPAARDTLLLLPGSEIDISVQVSLRTRRTLLLDRVSLEGGRWLAKDLPFTGEASVHGDWGERRTLSFRVPLPEETLPSDYDLCLGFTVEAASEPWVSHRLGSVVLTRLGVLHTLRKETVPGWKAESVLGKVGYRDAACRAVIAAGWSVAIPVPGHGPFRGCALVTGVSHGAGALHGEALGRLRVVMENGEAFSFPLRIGRETAEMHAERPGGGTIGDARVWSTFPVSTGGDTFDAHTYLAVFEFPEQERVAAALIEVNASRRLFLHVFHALFLEIDE